MHVDLSVAWNPGDDFPSTTWADVRLTEIYVYPKADRLRCNCQWGNWDGTTWTAGAKYAETEYTGADYDAIMDAAATASELTEHHLERALLDKLVADGDLVGTVADGG